MENVWIRNKKSKLSLYSKIVLGTLALAVIVGLGAATQAASDNTDNRNEQLFGQMSFFDPFALRTITLPAGSSSTVRILSGTISRSRPAIRTPLPQLSNEDWTEIIWLPIRPPVRTRVRPA